MPDPNNNPGDQNPTVVPTSVAPLPVTPAVPTDPVQTPPVAPTLPPSPPPTIPDLDIPPMPGNVPGSQVSDIKNPGTPKPAVDLPPVVITSSVGSASRAFSGRKAVAAILGVLVLVGGVGAGVFLTKQSQETREKAAFKSNEIFYTCNAGKSNEFKIGLSGISENPACNVTVGQCPTTTNDLTEYSTTYQIKAYPANGTDSYTFAYTKNSNFCDEKCGTDHPDNPAVKGVCAINPVAETQTATLSGDNNYEMTVTVSRKSSYDTACGTFQTDLWLESIENCPDFTPHTPGQSDLLSWGLCYTGVDCQQTTAQCLDTRAYKVNGSSADPANWTQLATSDLQNLKANDVIYLTARAKGSGLTGAIFTVNGVTRTLVTALKPRAAADPADIVEFYDIYTVPSGTTQFNISATVQ